MAAPVRVLVVDDDEITCNLLEEVLSKEGYAVHKALDGREAIDRGQKHSYDVVLSDIKMIDVDGMEVLRAYRQRSPETIIIMMTAFGSIETAIRAIKEGAYDYVSKPFKLDEIKLTLQRALEQRRLVEENIHYRQELITKYKLENIVGRSPQMLQVYKTIARVAESRSTVLVTGESGTGKELIARAIHFNSPRAARPFVAVDCSSLAETLLESELFGHVRGAFTGAVTTKKGLFEEADRGTCFLDEIGDISLAMQAKLLRVLQEHEIKRVGGTETIKIDVRIVAATNQNLEASGYGKEIPGRPLLPSQRGFDSPSFPPGTTGGCSAPGRPFPEEVCVPEQQARLPDLPGSHGSSGPPPVAGERAGAGKRD